MVINEECSRSGTKWEIGAMTGGCGMSMKQVCECNCASIRKSYTHWILCFCLLIIGASERSKYHVVPVKDLMVC